MSGFITQSIGQWQAWIPTFTGFSADPTGVTARYTLNGKMCTIYLNSSAPGTSNATTFTFTLPFAAANTAAQVFTCVGMNAGTQQQCRIQTAANSNICTCYSSPAAAAWTASGNKMIYPSSYTYEIA